MKHLLAVSLDPIPGGSNNHFPTFGSFISIIVKNAISLSGIVLLCLLIYGGFIIMSSAGGDPKKANQGQQLITNAIVGFIIIVAAYLIIQAIEFVTGLTIL